IIRTAAEGADSNELAQDAAFLKRLWLKVLERRGKHKGFIIRTAAEGADSNELAQDAAFLKRLWLKVLERRG
ncbi:ribonuclease E/G, partial [Vibrio splendidus]